MAKLSVPIAPALRINTPETRLECGPSTLKGRRLDDRLSRACPHVVVDDLKILRVGHAIEVEVVGARQTPRGIDRRVVGHVLRVNHAVAVTIARTCNLREASVPDLDYWTLAIKESKDPSPVPRRAATTFLETL